MRAIAESSSVPERLLHRSAWQVQFGQFITCLERMVANEKSRAGWKAKRGRRGVLSQERLSARPMTVKIDRDNQREAFEIHSVIANSPVSYVGGLVMPLTERSLTTDLMTSSARTPVWS